MRLNNSSSLALASLLCAAPSYSSGFLSTGPGARAAAMGGAFTGLADDPSAIFYNPAGLAGQRGAVMAEHVPINESGTGLSFNDGRLDFLGLQYPTGIGTVGLGFYQFGIGGIEGRENLSDPATNLNVTQTAYFVPYGVKLGPLSVGATGKVVQYSLGQYSGSGYGADAGALISVFHGDGFMGRDTNAQVGVAVRNVVAPTLKLYQDPTPIERVTAIGASVTSLVREGYQAANDTIVHDQFALTMEASKGNMDTPLSIAAGAEYAFVGSYSIRGGLSSNGNITVGLGLGGPRSRFRFDYAAGLAALAPQHHFTLTWLFTDPAAPVEGEVHFSEFQRAVEDQRRLKDRFVREGRDAASQSRYDEALADFRKAAVLDPSDEEVAGLVTSASDGSRLAGVKVRLDAARRELAAGHDELAAKSALDAVVFDPTSREAADYAAQLRNILISTGAAVVFDAERSRLLDQDAKIFEEAFMDHNLDKAKATAEKLKAVSPDNVAAWQPLVERVNGAVHDWCRDYEAQAARAAVTKDVIGMARAVRRIRRIDPNYSALERLNRQLKRLSRQSSSSFYNKNYLRQLYDTAAADYVLGDYVSAARHLGVLLNENALHEWGNALVDSMRDEGAISDGQEP